MDLELWVLMPLLHEHEGWNDVGRRRVIVDEQLVLLRLVAWKKIGVELMVLEEVGHPSHRHEVRGEHRPQAQPIAINN